MIKAIIFDLDGMIYLTEKLWSRHFSEKYGMPTDVLDAFFEKEFQLCLVGKADAKKEIKKHIANHDPSFDIDILFDSWFNYGSVDKDMILQISKIRDKGIKCALCTNNERHRIDHLSSKFGLSEIFDMVVASFQVGCKKPQKEMFELLERKICEKKENILFCDDDIKNCDAARAFGFRVHRFIDVKGFLKHIQTINS